MYWLGTVCAGKGSRYLDVGYERVFGATLSSIFLFSQSELFMAYEEESPLGQVGVWHRRQSVCLSLLPLPSLSKSTERQILAAGCKGVRSRPHPSFYPKVVHTSSAA